MLKVGRDPEALAVSADATRLLVSNYAIGEAAAFDVGSGNELGRFKVGERPFGVAMRQDGGLGYVTAHGALNVIDVAHGTFAGAVRLGAANTAVTFSRDGKLAYVGDKQSHAITVLDTEQHLPVASIELGDPYAQAVAAAVSPDGARLYVATGLSNNVVVIDLGTRKVAKVIEKLGDYTAASRTSRRARDGSPRGRQP